MTPPNSLLNVTKGAEQDTEDSDTDPMRAKSALSSMSSRSERAEGENMRAFHHNIAAMMAVVSLFAGDLSHKHMHVYKCRNRHCKSLLFRTSLR